MFSSLLSRLAALRAPLLALIACGTAGAILYRIHLEYPIQRWLLLAVFGQIALALYWALSCLSGGLALIQLLRLGHLEPRLRCVIAFPLGVLAFGWFVFLTAAAGLLHAGFFWWGPLVFLLLGALQLRRLTRSLRRLRLPRFSPLETSLICFGVLGLLWVYLPLLTPHNIQHDSRWYHLPIAQQYATSGGLGHFPEGWILGSYPHFSSLLYTWALLWPNGIVMRLGLCAHLEFMIFLATIASLPSLIRLLEPSLRSPATWACIFLFPGLLVYDSNLGTGADHIAALWAPAALLVLLSPRGFRESQRMLLLGVFAGAAAFTKYSAFCLTLPVLAAGGLRALGPVLQSSSRSWLSARRASLHLSLLGGFCVLVTFPHWFSNWRLFGDPLFPILYKHLPSALWHPQIEHYFTSWQAIDFQRPSRDFAGILQALGTTFSLGFSVNEYGFHGDLPTFGFLFAGTLYLLVLSRPQRATLLTYGLSCLGIFVWYWINHRDRYLQTILPWLVAGSMVVLWRTWKAGLFGRIAVVSLVGAQLIAGAGIFFYRSHTMVPGNHPLPHVAQLIADGYDRNKRGQRFKPYSAWNFSHWVELSKQLPEDAHVLIHEDRLWVGLTRPAVTDEATWQAGIAYSRMDNLQDIHQTFRKYGVTHVITGGYHGEGDHGLRGYILFWNFLGRYGEEMGNSGPLKLWKIQTEIPPADVTQDILLQTCAGPAGIYSWSDLAALTTGSPLPAARPLPLGRFVPSSVDLIVTEDKCAGKQRFKAERLSRKGNLHFLKPSQPQPAPPLEEAEPGELTPHSTQ